MPLALRMARYILGNHPHLMAVGPYLCGALPNAPMGLELSSEAASTFGQALSIGKNLQVNADGTSLLDGQSIEFFSELNESLVLEFDEGLMLQLGSTGAVDGNHFTLHHGSGSSTFEFEHLEKSSKLNFKIGIGRCRLRNLNHHQ